MRAMWCLDGITEILLTGPKMLSSHSAHVAPIKPRDAVLRRSLSLVRFELNAFWCTLYFAHSLRAAEGAICCQYTVIAAIKPFLAILGW